MELVCRHCGSGAYKRNGTSRGTRRFLCQSCGRTFTDQTRHYGAAVKQEALRMHLNNVGIRKIALFLGCAPASVVNWIRAAHRDLAEQLRRAAEQVEAGAVPDVIEMDEVYTFVQKSSTGPWCGLLSHDGRLAWLPTTSATKA
jgi:transposase-like protein